MKNKLSMAGMLDVIRPVFKKIGTPKGKMAIEDCLLSGLSIFSLKYKSLLQYDNQRADIGDNLKRLFGIAELPCDTYMRERLDEVDPRALRGCFTKLFAEVQRSKKLEPYQYLDNKYLISLDGTGYFSSKTVHCDQCCQKKHKNGSVTYYHHILQAAVVNPVLKQVIPLAPEPISQQDGHTKNDCELNAAKRFLTDFRREHPKLPVTLLADALYANEPFVKALKQRDMSFILNVKPANHKWLFDYFKAEKTQIHEHQDEQGVLHYFEFINQAPLNSSETTHVNLLFYRQTMPKGETKNMTWITDFKLTKDNVFTVMQGGRSRWKIENETFNTLKNQGYEFEHNFGHGKKNLSHVFAMLMLLAFTIDQIMEMSCKLFQSALKAAKKRRYLWERITGVLFNLDVLSWSSLYDGIAHQRSRPKPVFNDSG